MMLAIACPVQPEDPSRRVSRGKRVQHRQDRRRTDTRAEQHDRSIAALQDETPAWRADVEHIAHPNMLVQVGACRAVGFDLYADAIALRRWGTRDRVAPEEWRPAGVLGEAEDEVLTWQGDGQRMTGRMLKCQREDVC